MLPKVVFDRSGATGMQDTTYCQRISGPAYYCPLHPPIMTNVVRMGTVGDTQCIPAFHLLPAAKHE
jgi:hypothetical protein